MNCQEVQPTLSEYIDKSLDAIRMKAVETHLSSCVACRAEVQSLIDCIHQIADLPVLEPPLGFAQRVMAHVREIEPKPNRWQRLLSQFKIAVPIQVTAVVLTGIVVLTLYQKEVQIRNNEPAQQSSTPIAPAPSSLDHASVPARPQVNGSQTNAHGIKHEDSKAVAARLPDAEPRKKANPQSLSATVQPPATARSSAAPTTDSSAGDMKNPLTRRGPIPAQEVANGIEGFGPIGGPFGGAPRLGGSLRPGFFLPERVFSPISEPVADIEFVVRRRASQGDQDVAPAAATAEQSNPPPAAAVREVRWFAVPPDQYDQFKKELVSEASIESEKTVGAMDRDFALKSNRELLIKVVIVSPADR